MGEFFSFKKSCISPMELQEETDRCRLCFLNVTKSINIFNNSILVPSIIEPLKQYFHDEVTESDILPKIICWECWEKIEEFQKFADEAILLRDEYLQKCFSDGEKFDDEEKVGVTMVFENDGDSDKSSGIMSLCESSTKQENTHVQIDDELHINNSKDLILPDFIDTSCDMCSYTNFKTFNELRLHFMESHDSIGYVKCCETKFSRRDLLEEHIELHSNPDLFKYSCEEYLDLHKRSRKLNHDCEFCGKVFKTNSSLKNHLASHSNGSPAPKPKLKFQCTLCKVWLSSKSSLKLHLQTHTAESSRCHKCNKVFSHSYGLVRHIRIVHFNRIYRCHLCNKAYKRGDSLRDHIETHQNHKIYKCTFCEESFGWRSNMYKHRKLAHRMEWLAEKMEKESARMKA
ncbi:zinc finger protein 267-like isoform X2 [Contarinia nasturtii]|uniref:zinc finger protein 267-like isoform X2 n=1 Tax=Contarinia nasturtii TaxID=265458 RepID=UPI0012D47636|nr:zinc finger protein 267-like isoform X2 [Contarinia nasturtii]